jgi:nicotinate-nucleotide adenylyltransferase
MEYLPENFNKPIHRVAVFGGSFDPPTLGHQNVVEQLLSLSNPKIDEIILIPSVSHAFGKKLSNLPDRVAMLKLFIEDLEEIHPNLKTKIHIFNIEPDLISLHSTGYVYTYDVLEAVEKIYQVALLNLKLSSAKANSKIQICFVIGPDLASPDIFNRFYRANEIKKKWPIIVVKQMRDIRSTEVRQDIAKNGLNNLNCLNSSLSPRVRAEIIRQKRYISAPVSASAIKIKLDLVIFSIQYNDLYLLLNQNSNQLPYALIDPSADTQLEEALNKSMMSQLGELPKYHEQVITRGGQKREQKNYLDIEHNAEPESDLNSEWCLSITYFCLTNKNNLIHLNQSDNTGNIWVKISDFMAESLSIDQKNSVVLCVERLKNKASYTSIPCYLATESFTLSDLQKIYEIVLGYKLEKKSFRRRFIESGLLEDTGNARKANHRPAQLYQLSRKAHIPYYFTRIIEGSRSH